MPATGEISRHAPIYRRSGGIGYHLVALRHANNLWRAYRDTLSDELLRRFRGFQDPSASRPVVIVGPSGGYTISDSVLEFASEVIAVDVDRWAPYFFGLRHSRPHRWIRGDFFQALGGYDWDLGRWWKEGSLGKPEQSPIFLFSNILGQLEFIYHPVELREIEAGLARALGPGRREGIDWVSVHDRLAIPASHFEDGLESTVLRSPEHPSIEEIARFYGSSRLGNSPIEVEEHAVGEWIRVASPDFALMPWRLIAKSLQIAEVASSRR